jgi:hypothetical protein
MSSVAIELPDAQGHFGILQQTLRTKDHFRAQHDPEFQPEIPYYLTEFVCRSTPFYFAERLTKDLGGTGESSIDLAIEAKKLGWLIFLSGGLTPVNATEAVAKVQPFGVDVSSGGIAPGKKDAEKADRFFQAAKKISS